ncbi:hypothetical protein CBR_g57928 [Chara braunii]|uniref:Uncharacterized protein n=1 Tax=Chara braunii TaxID=69332 RepID=A0A388MEP2_CHABU|nr:hypothetical protein CBR_g57928 [Chara braunii]|eukprot:GBG92959.1 hypothetical protein CBR_g57928 [Chara braunii]
MRLVVTTKSGPHTTPYIVEQAERAAAILREQKEKQAWQKEAKKLALLEERVAKKRELKEEMERLLKEQEEKIVVVEKEEEEEEEVSETALKRMARGVTKERGESSGTSTEKEEVGRITGEWASRLEIGEEQEARLLVPQVEKEAVQRELEEEESPLHRRALE